MLSFVMLPTRSTFTTRPSAGDTMIRGSGGIERLGFRKKNATKTASKSRKIPAAAQASQKLIAAAATRGSRKINASLTIMNAILQGRRERRSFVPLCLRVLVIQNTKTQRQDSKYADDSVRSGTFGSWSSSGL